MVKQLLLTLLTLTLPACDWYYQDVEYEMTCEQVRCSEHDAADEFRYEDYQSITCYWYCTAPGGNYETVTFAREAGSCWT